MMSRFKNFSVLHTRGRQFEAHIGTVLFTICNRNMDTDCHEEFSFIIIVKIGFFF